jgi:excisionase family DNA binding protein
MPIDDPCFMTVAEVAELLRVTKMTVYRLVHEGGLPAIVIRRSIRIREADVRSLLSP